VIAAILAEINREVPKAVLAQAAFDNLPSVARGTEIRLGLNRRAQGPVSCSGEPWPSVLRASSRGSDEFRSVRDVGRATIPELPARCKGTSLAAY
jgi:hypothetical protein